MPPEATPPAAEPAEPETLVPVEMPPDLTRLDYGLDSPSMVKTLAILGGAVLLLCFLMRGPAGASFASAPLTSLRWAGMLCLLQAGLMWWSSSSGKLQERDLMLESLEWRGDEQVLDVGCGRGLMMIGAAKRLTTGRAVGVDVWRSADLSDNWSEAVWDNARAEGVEDRIDVRDGDMRQLPFADASFDVVLSSLALTSLSKDADRRQAIDEITRVLRPDGRVALLESSGTKRYEEAFRAAGFRKVERSGYRLRIFPPARVVVAARGGAAPANAG